MDKPLKAVVIARIDPQISCLKRDIRVMECRFVSMRYNYFHRGLATEESTFYPISTSEMTYFPTIEESVMFAKMYDPDTRILVSIEDQTCNDNILYCMEQRHFISGFEMECWTRPWQK